MSIRKITIEQLRAALNLRDLSNPAEGPHAMQMIMEEVLSALRDVWRCNIVVHRDNPIVSIADNYDRLNYPKDGASRNTRYTRYVCDTALLRTQASAMVPDAMRNLAEPMPQDVLIALPGLTYRRDSVDRIHCPEPHHLDLWRLRKSTQENMDMDVTDLMNMIDVCVNAALPGIKWRVSPTPHPYTLQGVQIDALWGEEWIEIGECGLAHPDIIKANIKGSDKVTGLAMGLGLDRILMIRKNIPDIRLLRSTDPRVCGQMLDLEPYKPVSTMPPVIRDLSIVMDDDMIDDDIGDIVRESLAENSDIVEQVKIISETSYSALPEAARNRLGIKPHQKNVLIRVVMRALSRTLTAEECNLYRDIIYTALHKGSEWQWACEKSANSKTA